MILKRSRPDIRCRVKNGRRALSGLTIGIDATNLRQGGGVTHIVELLRAAQPELHGASRVVVFGGRKTLAAMEDRPWLEKHDPPELDRGIVARALWQRFRLSRAARHAGCDVLFVPGGSYAGNFKPAVTMSQNLLPFEMQELRRYGWSLRMPKLLLLRWMQSRTFRHADGLIFLTEYARHSVMNVTGEFHGRTTLIPHGLDTRFHMKPKAQRAITEYRIENPYRLIYVSIIDRYKHQWHVVEAVAALRRAGLPVTLDLVGPAYPPALARLEASIERWDPQRSWVQYHGAIPYGEVHEMYAQADLGLFASSCENMPNILLETMAAGLPVACSNRGPMPEILRDAGTYFDPEKPLEIVRVLRELIGSPQMRAEKALASYQQAQRFSWQRCAKDTFEFLAQVALQHKASACSAS